MLAATKLKMSDSEQKKKIVNRNKYIIFSKKHVASRFLEVSRCSCIMTYTKKCAARAKLSNETNWCTCKVVVVVVFFTVYIVLHHFKFCLT